MEKIFILALALTVSLGTTAVLANGGYTARHPQSDITKMASDGAFRDGLYIGRLAAEGRQPQSPPIGRWSAERDRASFVEGYRRGYAAVLASVN